MKVRLPLLRRGTMLVSPDKPHRYHIRECLGGGGFGRVYRARALHLKNKEVCVKATRDLETWSAEVHWFKVFSKDRRVVTLLDHFVVHRNGNAVYILVLEYANEGSLLDYVSRNGAVPERKAVRETSALLHTLDKLHGIHGIHRDLTPMNVLVFRPFRLRFSDFGIARQSFTDGCVPGAWTCNPDWVPSEVRKRGRASYTSDLFQMGLILFYMLTGEDDPPRSGKARRGKLKTHGTSPELVRIIEKALAHRPGKRYASAEDMLADLRTLSWPEALGESRNEDSPGREDPAAARAGRRDTADDLPAEKPSRTELRMPLRIYGFRYDSLVHRGVLFKNGEVRVLQPVRKKRYGSLTRAASQLVGYSKNGWEHWHYYDQERQVYHPLKDVRERVEQGIQDGPRTR